MSLPLSVLCTKILERKKLIKLQFNHMDQVFVCILDMHSTSLVLLIEPVIPR